MCLQRRRVVEIERRERRHNGAEQSLCVKDHGSPEQQELEEEKKKEKKSVTRDLS